MYLVRSKRHLQGLLRTVRSTCTFTPYSVLRHRLHFSNLVPHAGIPTSSTASGRANRRRTVCNFGPFAESGLRVPRNSERAERIHHHVQQCSTTRPELLGPFNQSTYSIITLCLNSWHATSSTRARSRAPCQRSAGLLQPLS
jgi:hypothetical protein